MFMNGAWYDAYSFVREINRRVCMSGWQTGVLNRSILLLRTIQIQ